MPWLSICSFTLGHPDSPSSLTYVESLNSILFVARTFPAFDTPLRFYSLELSEEVIKINQYSTPSSPPSPQGLTLL